MVLLSGARVLVKETVDNKVQATSAPTSPPKTTGCRNQRPPVQTAIIHKSDVPDTMVLAEDSESE